MQLVDTHCHIHIPEYKLEPDEVIAAAHADGVTRLLCVGCTLEDSTLAVEFVRQRPGCWATIGLHPHEAQHYVDKPETRAKFAALATQPKVVAVGECGLDYYYKHSPAAAQRAVLKFQIELALEHDLPMIFHVRDAFEDFWKIFDEYQGIRGVVHSFSSSPDDLQQILQRGLYVGLNGIMTFTKRPEQLAAAKQVPLDRLLVETDAPFLTPTPYRGTICQPKHALVTAEFLSALRGESPEVFAAVTTQNAATLFKLTQANQ